MKLNTDTVWKDPNQRATLGVIVQYGVKGRVGAAGIWELKREGVWTERGRRRPESEVLFWPSTTSGKGWPVHVRPVLGGGGVDSGRGRRAGAFAGLADRDLVGVERKEAGSGCSGQR
ncbi:hypothetical protein RJT34_17720 [Clitoria ternatea]|uniref:Uncharacterized protein n=1 Tax=Clitoria ternatea TaxID=43366 RepID=A0AAN9JBN9_CLITE